jgi:hypothetical protein
LTLLKTLAAVSLLLLAGCALRADVRPVSIPGTAAILSRLESRKFPDSFRSIVLVEADAPGDEGVMSPLRDVLTEAGESYVGKAVLLWRRPASLRMEFLSPFGSPVFVVAAGRGNLTALSISRGVYYTGPADTETMAKWLGLPVSPRLMVRILGGELPAVNREAPGAARTRWDEEAKLIRLDLPPGAGLGRRQAAFLEPGSLEPRWVLIGEAGAAIEVRYGPFTSHEGGRRPSWAELRDRRRGRRLRVHMTEKSARPEKVISPELFELPIPPGARVIPLFPGVGR